MKLGTGRNDWRHAICRAAADTRLREIVAEVDVFYVYLLTPVSISGSRAA